MFGFFKKKQKSRGVSLDSLNDVLGMASIVVAAAEGKKASGEEKKEFAMSALRVLVDGASLDVPELLLDLAIEATVFEGNKKRKKNV